MKMAEMETIRDERGGHFHCENDCDHAVFREREDGELVCVFCGSDMVECSPEICEESGS